MGHNYIGQNYIGHNYIGHTYTGHNYIGRDYLGHGYIQAVACRRSTGHLQPLQGPLGAPPYRPSRLHISYGILFMAPPHGPAYMPMHMYIRMPRRMPGHMSCHTSRHMLRGVSRHMCRRMSLYRLGTHAQTLARTLVWHISYGILVMAY